MSKDQVIDRVKKLLEMTESNGCTASEAATAMAMAQKLMAQHGIHECDVVEEPEFIIEEEVTVGTKSVSSMQALMALDLSKHFGCRVVQHTRADGSQYLKFIGDKTRCQVFRETYLFAYRVFQKNWTSYIKDMEISTKEKNQLRGSYFKGFVSGLTNELIRSENEFGLVIVESAKLTEYMKDNYSNNRTRQCSVRSNGSSEAYLKGYEDGTFSHRNKNKCVEQA